MLVYQRVTSPTFAAQIFAAVKHDQGVREIAGHILSAWVACRDGLWDDAEITGMRFREDMYILCICFVYIYIYICFTYQDIFDNILFYFNIFNLNLYYIILFFAIL